MNLYHGDCLEVLPTFPPASVEAIITDLPYGTTACEWDSIIPFMPMWEQVKRVLKPDGVFVTTASQPFTSALIMSNPKFFKYCWIWDKVSTTGSLISKIQPMRAYEDIAVFYWKQCTYNPQLRIKPKNAIRSSIQIKSKSSVFNNDTSFKRHEFREIPTDKSYPTNVIRINGYGKAIKRFHPTQKPDNLYEYLIRTYTNAGETVLDICMGSGTTGVAAIQTGRNFIGIEKEQKYFEIASRRIAQAPQPLFTEPPRQPTPREPDLKLESEKLSGFE